LQQAGIPVTVGIDLDRTCCYSCETNVGVPFLWHAVGTLRPLAQFSRCAVLQ